MDFNDTPEEAAFRAEIRTFIQSEAPKPKKGQKKDKKKKTDAESQQEDDTPAVWMTFNTIKEALKAGWEVCL